MSTRRTPRTPYAARVRAALVVRRARLLVLLAGLAWFLGLTPPAPVRLLLVGLVAAGAALDAATDALPVPGGGR